MKKRVSTALVLAAIAGGAVLAGHAVQLAAIMCVCVLCAWETARLLYPESLPDRLFQCAASAGVAACGAFAPHAAPHAAFLAIIALSVKDISAGRAKAAELSMSVWCLTLTGYFFSAGVSLFESDALLFLVCIATSVVTDCAALFGGMKLGRRKLAPLVSANKTWEGAACGFIFGTAPFIIAGFLTGRSAFFAYAPLSAALGQFGDLASSMIKRHFGVKDFSNLLPGHGGALDRIDNMLFVWAAVYSVQSALARVY